MRAPRVQGFTLTELIIVIVLMGILATVATPLIANKFSAVHQSTRRAHWVQQAEYALFTLRQDLANSVPNSVFVDASGEQVEFLGALPTADLYAARYRDQPYAPNHDHLRPNNDISFDIFGAFSIAPIYVSIGTANAVQMRSDWQNHLGGTNSGTLARISNINASPTGAENGGPKTLISLVANHDFGGDSLYFRAYFTNGPIAYDCNTTNQRLYRVKAYDILDPTLDFVTRSALGNRARVIDSLAACTFELIAGTTYQPPALRVSLEIGDSSETIQLFDTILLSNGS